MKRLVAIAFVVGVAVGKRSVYDSFEYGWNRTRAERWDRLMPPACHVFATSIVYGVPNEVAEAVARMERAMFEDVI